MQQFEVEKCKALRASKTGRTKGALTAPKTLTAYRKQLEKDASDCKKHSLSDRPNKVRWQIGGEIELKLNEDVPV